MTETMETTDTDIEKIAALIPGYDIAIPLILMVDSNLRENQAGITSILDDESRPKENPLFDSWPTSDDYIDEEAPPEQADAIRKGLRRLHENYPALATRETAFASLLGEEAPGQTSIFAAPLPQISNWKNNPTYKAYYDGLRKVACVILGIKDIRTSWPNLNIAEKKGHITLSANFLYYFGQISREHITKKDLSPDLLEERLNCVNPTAYRIEGTEQIPPEDYLNMARLAVLINILGTESPYLMIDKLSTANVTWKGNFGPDKSPIDRKFHITPKDPEAGISRIRE